MASLPATADLPSASILQREAAPASLRSQRRLGEAAAAATRAPSAALPSDGVASCQEPRLFAVEFGDLAVHFLRPLSGGVAHLLHSDFFSSRLAAPRNFRCGFSASPVMAAAGDGCRAGLCGACFSYEHLFGLAARRGGRPGVTRRSLAGEPQIASSIGCNSSGGQRRLLALPHGLPTCSTSRQVFTTSGSAGSQERPWQASTLAIMMAARMLGCWPVGSRLRKRCTRSTICSAISAGDAAAGGGDRHFGLRDRSGPCRW